MAHSSTPCNFSSGLSPVQIFALIVSIQAFVTAGSCNIQSVPRASAPSDTRPAFSSLGSDTLQVLSANPILP